MNVWNDLGLPELAEHARETKKSAEIIIFPGVERRDLCGPPIPDKLVFETAIKARVREGIVVGKSPTGQQYVATAGADMDRIVGQLFAAVTFLSRLEAGTNDTFLLLPEDGSEDEPDGAA